VTDAVRVALGLAVEVTVGLASSGVVVIVAVPIGVRLGVALLVAVRVVVAPGVSPPGPDCQRW